MNRWVKPATAGVQGLKLATMAILAGVAFSATAAAVETYSATSAISLPGGQKITSFDLFVEDPMLGRAYLSDRTNKSIDVIDVSSNTVVAQFKPGFAGAQATTATSGPNGVVVVDHAQLWVGDGDSTVKVLDINSGALLATINTGGSNRADELCYDPADHLVSIANDKDGFISLISTTSQTVVKQIKFDGSNGAPKATNGIEQCQYDPRIGMFLQNIPEVNGPGDDSAPGAVVVISPTAGRITQIFNIPIEACAGNQGMAIGPGNQVILGCALHGSVILDDRDFSIVAQLPDDYGVDVAAFNPGNNHYFLAESGHSPPKLGVIRAPLGAPAMSAGVPTNSGGGTPHSVVAEQLFNQAYVPIASNANGNICSSGGGVDANGCIAVYSTGPSPTTIVSAILPNARTTTVGNPVTAFATVMNTGGKVATQCAIGSPDGLQADLLFQQTNPATNQPVGTLNSPALSIAPGASQSFVFRIDPTASFVSEIPLVFNCADAAPAVHVAGLNNFLLNASSVPIPDMLSISDTLTHDGNIVISGATGSGVMGVATIDIGPVGGTIIATATDTPFGQLPRNLPIDLALCQTNSSGVCQGPLAQSLTISGVTPNQVLTFTVVATAKGITIPYIPQFNRAFVSLTSNGSPVGETGAAIKMQ